PPGAPPRISYHLGISRKGSVMVRVFGAILLVATASVSVQPSRAQSESLFDAQCFNVGGYAHAVVAGDFNADGRPDVAAATSGNKVTILLGQSDGSLVLFGSYS